MHSTEVRNLLKSFTTSTRENRLLLHENFILLLHETSCYFSTKKNFDRCRGTGSFRKLAMALHFLKFLLSVLQVSLDTSKAITIAEVAQRVPSGLPHNRWGLPGKSHSKV